jgi:hypothetical protein
VDVPTAYCGQTYSIGDNGAYFIMSPNYPGNYPTSY